MGQSSANYNVEILPLAFDIVKSGIKVVDKTVSGLDDAIANTIKDPSFKIMLKKAALDSSSKVIKNFFSGAALDLSKNFNDVVGVGSAAIGEGIDASVKYNLESSPQVKLLNQEMFAFKKALESTPTGIWINENKTTLVVMGAIGIMAGGGVYLYNSKNGTLVANKIQTLTKEYLSKAWKVGSIDISSKLTKLDLEKNEFAVQVDLNSTWKPYNADVAVQFMAEKNEESLTASAVFKMISDVGFLSAGMSYKENYPVGMASNITNEPEIKGFMAAKFRSGGLDLDLNISSGSNDDFEVMARVTIAL